MQCLRCFKPCYLSFNLLCTVVMERCMLKPCILLCQVTTTTNVKTLQMWITFCFAHFNSPCIYQNGGVVNYSTIHCTTTYATIYTTNCNFISKYSSQFLYGKYSSSTLEKLNDFEYECGIPSFFNFGKICFSTSTSISRCLII